MLDQLRQTAIFAKTIDHGSFRGAARELGLSPSVISHHVSQLEEHLGVALIYRTTRKLALTKAGEQLLASTQPMLSSVEGALSELSGSASNPTGELRIAMAGILIHSPLTEKLAAFSMQHPGIKLSLNCSDERQDIISGGYDMAIRMGLTRKRSTSMRTLFKVQRRLMASSAYLGSRPKISSPSDLEDWNWIELTPVSHLKPTFRKSASKQVKIKPTAHLAANNALAVYQLVRSGAGLAVLPEFLADDGIKLGEIEFLLPDWKLEPIDVYAEWPSNVPKSGLIRLLVDAISPSQSLR